MRVCALERYLRDLERKSGRERECVRKESKSVPEERAINGTAKKKKDELT
ncbi:hypothetical protein WH47_05872 [Habropoda laboriosa]|uniref:Uncharacterized protein n=1 Tax=Habropoda laboriosa TaxID=597456 RepID=A0A0L7QTL2_9HYME|nr:hypothetical protein WH47_05872 [Habropoda laboriosa]